MTTAQRGTPAMAAHLMALWVSRDHPCVVKADAEVKAGLHLLSALGRLTEDGLQCQFCGGDFVHVGTSWFHPDTPALLVALEA